MSNEIEACGFYVKIYEVRLFMFNGQKDYVNNEFDVPSLIEYSRSTKVEVLLRDATVKLH